MDLLNDNYIYRGFVSHYRFYPKIHKFKYRVFSMLLNLEELESLDKKTRLFSINKFNLFSFFYKDHSEEPYDNPLYWAKKILDSKIKITSTSVRIPVLVSHAVSVNVEFNKKYKLNEIRSVLNTSPGCKVLDEHKDGGYITPAEAENKFETFISRIREDQSQANSINLWVVSDNLLKGAALNAVEIAETLIKNI